MNDFPLALDVSNPLHWLPVLLALGIALNSVRLRRHLSGLATLAPSDEPVDPSHRFVIAEGVILDEATRRAASAFARRGGLEVVDLILADLHVDRALGLARVVDTRTFRADRLAPGGGAFQATLADAAILERAGITRLEGLDPFEIAHVTTCLKRYASASTDLAVASALRATPNEPEKGLAFLPRPHPAQAGQVHARAVRRLWAHLQNPRLSIEGLDFYYRDFYDGLGEAAVRPMFAAQREHYLARARMLQGIVIPTR